MNTPDGVYWATMRGGRYRAEVIGGRWFFADGTGWKEPFADGETPVSFEPAQPLDIGALSVVHAAVAAYSESGVEGIMGLDLTQSPQSPSTDPN